MAGASKAAEGSGENVEMHEASETPSVGALPPGVEWSHGHGAFVTKPPAMHFGGVTAEHLTGALPGALRGMRIGGDGDANSVLKPGAEVSSEWLVSLVGNMQGRLNHLEGELEKARKTPFPEDVLKKSKLETFSGSNKDDELDVRNWLESAEDEAKTLLKAGKTPIQAVNTLASYLRGAARVHWNACKSRLELEAKIVTLDVFKDVMINGFGGLDPVQDGWAKLKNLKQGNRSVQDYAQKFQAIIFGMGTGAPSENDQIERFKDGLHESLIEKCASMSNGARWSKLTELVNFASNVWNVKRRNSPAVPPSESGVPRTFGQGSKNKGNFKRKGGSGSNAEGGTGGGSNGKRAKTGGNGQASGSEQSGKISKAERDRRFRDGLCLVCGDKNHRANACPKKPSQPVN